ncbi:hypothetical protein WSS_A25795 [Rhodococcus opacus M213]|uniref:Tripartite ATP-independent periplasmic transporters DctQ component domain-containing protein n=1 Tax=Rhodococcus opacus M213 TaxID=1129896 RepID=K8XE36_RHOOP|nr:TRAP transporter small permease [Rhodococcus opacus]EKT79833.1 hypothetical protein WSS_A25795 [Rhodococcus opacus M213]
MTETTVHAFRDGTARRTTFGYITEDNPRLDRIQNAISAVCGSIATVSVLAIVLLTLVDLVARVLFSEPQGWSVTFIEYYLMTSTAFFGIVTAYRSGAHVAVVSLFSKLGPVPRKALLVLAYVVVIAGMAAIGVAGLSAAVFSWTSGESPVPGSSELRIPSWLWRSIVPISMAMGIVIVSIDLLREVFSPWTAPVTDYDPGDEVDAVLEEVEALAPARKEADQ